MTEHLFARLTDIIATAADLPFVPPPGMSSTNVQDAIEEIRADQRTLLDADLDLYLSPTGDDILGDGSITNPWRQPQRVVDYLEEDVDIGGFRVDVHFADGSYDGVYNGNYQGGGVLYWRGNFTNPENVILGNVLNPNGFSVGSMNRLAVSDTEIWFNGFSMEPVQAPSIDSDPASAGVGKFLIFGDLDNFTDGRLILRGCQNNSTVMFGNIMDFGNFITVDGSALPASAGALLHSLSGDPFMASSLTITDNPSFSQGTIVVGPKSFAQIFWAYTGTTVGPKYLVVAGGQMFIDNPEAIPGTLPGKVEPTGFIRYTGPDGSFGNTAKLWDHVISKTAAYQLTGKDSYHHFDNQGTTTRVDFTLPNAGLDQYYGFTVADADGIRIIAKAGDTIRIKGTVTAAGGQIESFTIGDTIWLYAINATEWIALYVTGLWAGSNAVDTHTHTASQITDFQEATEDVVGAILDDDGGDLDWTYNDGANTLGASVKDDAITNAKMAEMAQATFKLRAAGAGTGNPIDGTAEQGVAVLDTVIPCVIAHKNGTAQTINDDTQTIITFGTEIVDRLGNWSTDTFTAPVAGIYLAVLCVTFESSSGDQMYNYILVNDVAVRQHFQLAGSAGAEFFITTAVLNLAANDTVKFRAYQDNAGGASRDIRGQSEQTNMSIVRLV